MKPGFDPLLQAYGGMMSVTGRAEDPPTFAGASINDKATGMFCTIGALAALRMRDKTGKGCLVDTSLFDSAVHWVEGQVNNYIASGAVPQRHGTGGAVIVPYQTFDTADGKPLCLAPGNDRLWARCAQALGHPEWATDPKYAKSAARVKYKDELLPMIAQAMLAQVTRRLDRGVREGGRALRCGQRHRRARQHAAVRRIGDRAGAAGRRPQGGRPADHLRPRAPALGAAVAQAG